MSFGRRIAGEGLGDCEKSTKKFAEIIHRDSTSCINFMNFFIG